MTAYPITEAISAITPSRRRYRVVGAVCAAAAAAVTVLPIGSAGADTPARPSVTHCPAAFPLLAISSFAPVYLDWLHTVIDLNGNGYVCAKLQPDAMATALAVTPPGYPIYLATDDSIVR